MDLDRVERRTVVQSVVEQLLDYIGQGNVTPGQKLASERELMSALGVGRSSLREALQALVALEVLETRPGRGYFVRRLRPAGIVRPETLGALIEIESLNDLIEVREVLEMEAIVLAAQRATADDLERLRANIREMKEALARGQRVYKLAAQFHTTLAEAAHNGVLVRLMQTVSSLLRARGERIEKTIANRSERELELHERLFEAVISRNPEQCRKAMSEHLMDARLTILSGETADALGTAAEHTITTRDQD